MKTYKYLVLIIFALAIFIATSNTLYAQSVAPIHITEVQTGGVSSETGQEDPQLEFIELYNASSGPISLAGLELQFLTEKHNGTDPPTRQIATFTDADVIEPSSFYIVSYSGYITNAQFYYQKYSSTGQLTKTSGSVRLYDLSQKTTVDLFGYGSALQNESKSAKAPAIGVSSQRCMQNGNAVDTNNNSVDFAEYAQNTPFGIPACIMAEPENPVPDPPNPPSDPPPSGGPIDTAPNPSENALQNSCAGIEVSEVLPNPAGADAGKEFIELFNSTNTAIDLNGCYLRLEGSNKEYTFAENIIAPQQYSMFSDLVTNFTLPNSSGDTVTLYDVNDVLLSTVAYGGGLDDDVSWAKVDGKWVATYLVTPNNPNIAVLIKPCPAGQIRNPQTERCVTEVTAASVSSASCPVGQERNPATNRCRAIVTSSVDSLVVCKPGQERNPQTNRCRTIASSVASLVACKPGQERNPETNRCRNIVTVASAKPCPAGQERNLETNRCRKIINKDSDFASTLGVADIPTTKGDMTGLILAGLIAVFAILYGLWAWRDDIRFAIKSFIGRMQRNPD